LQGDVPSGATMSFNMSVFLKDVQRVAATQKDFKCCHCNQSFPTQRGAYANHNGHTMEEPACERYRTYELRDLQAKNW
jgi:hypothetical protein